MRGGGRGGGAGEVRVGMSAGGNAGALRAICFARDLCLADRARRTGRGRFFGAAGCLSRESMAAALAVSPEQFAIVGDLNRTMGRGVRKFFEVPARVLQAIFRGIRFCGVGAFSVRLRV